MDRDVLLAEVTERLGDRRLVWSGLRGEDVEPLADLPQLHASYSIISRYRRRERIESLAYEDLTGERPDLEVFDIDDHLDEEQARAFRQAHLRTLSVASVLMPYRASPFLSAIWFARRDRCRLVGLFGAHQSAFEHKPWVESALQDAGIPTVPWVYIADEDQLTTKTLVRDGPVVLRRSRTSGGEGFTLVEDASELSSRWPAGREAFVSVAPFLRDSIPLNVGATVWHDGVTVHHPSVQLVGVPGCVTRPFGYCGNDFVAAASLDLEIIDEIERTTIAIGQWLRRHGYLGTFGVDYLFHQGRLLFTEINPRFQGSTHASCRLAIESNESCLMLEHVATFLGCGAPPARPLRDRVAEVSPIAHVVVHWTGKSPTRVDPTRLADAVTRHPRGMAAELRVDHRLVTQPGAVAVRLVVRDRITDTGHELCAPWHETIRSWVVEATDERPAAESESGR